MNKKYLVNGRVSESPVYWIAQCGDDIIEQINESGEIVNKWSELNSKQVDYWGIITNVGSYGFYLKEGICNMNGTKVRITSNESGTLSYKRTILSSSQGWTTTKSVKIGFCENFIQVNFLPKTHIVLTSSDN